MGLAAASPEEHISTCNPTANSPDTCCAAVWGAALFVVTLSLGESFWSPRWYDYSMSLAPYGREGIFTALASAPLFAAKLPTGVRSLRTFPPLAEVLSHQRTSLQPSSPWVGICCNLIPACLGALASAAPF